jgi:hypothetical protein
MQPPTPPRVDGVRVRTGIREAVPVRRATIQEPALHPRLYPHRRQHPMPSTHHLTLRLSTQQHHQRLMHRRLQLDRTTRLRQPHLHTHGSQPLNHHPELITVERPLILPHHNRIETTLSLLRRFQQRRSRRDGHPAPTAANTPRRRSPSPPRRHPRPTHQQPTAATPATSRNPENHWSTSARRTRTATRQIVGRLSPSTARCDCTPKHAHGHRWHPDPLVCSSPRPTPAITVTPQAASPPEQTNSGTGRCHYPSGRPHAVA